MTVLTPLFVVVPFTGVSRDCEQGGFLMPKTLQERFWEKVERTEGCWIWVGARARPQGYGVIWRNVTDGLDYAHRVSLELAGHVLVGGMHIDHLCRVRECVNPDHLEQVTPAENIRRGAAVTYGGSCKRGHERVPENWYYPRPGKRECKPCLDLRNYWKCEREKAATRARRGVTE